MSGFMDWAEALDIIRYTYRQNACSPQYTVGGITNIAQFKDYDRYPRWHSDEDASRPNWGGCNFQTCLLLLAYR
jgi:hypothetical protein